MKEIYTDLEKKEIEDRLRSPIIVWEITRILKKDEITKEDLERIKGLLEIK